MEYMGSDGALSLHEDRERRHVVKPSFAVVTVPVELPESLAEQGALPPPGTVVVHVGTNTAAEWRQLLTAGLEADWQTLSELAPAPARPAGGGYELLLRSRAYFDVRCAGKTLISGAILPEDRPYRAVSFPYTGGLVADDDFEIVEYRSAASLEEQARPEQEYLVLRRAPGLTELERELLGRVPPPELREIHIGTRQPCGPTATTMDQLVSETYRQATRDLTRAHGCVSFEDLRAMRLAEDTVRRVMGDHQEPAASVTELLNLRRQILEG
ncbi:hypothetical protein [Streptomyces melanogenes]|uniref:hypothetical protein n=1 Tax=Streptomyces melanogenes TaxID=67326 RepID=UPI0037AE4C96